ncbi:MAG: hypothetical protein KGV50_01855 [Gammaproteobacteria bacterium]|nr:hypothetical protein [Gammaproteobacteria bacterium]
MKQIKSHFFIIGLLIMSGCASMQHVTDSVVLTPDNAAAEKWGELSFYSQYKSGDKPSTINIELPNGKTLKGQLLFPYDFDNGDKKDGFWDKVSIGVGVGVGVGSHSRSGGFGSVGIGTGGNNRNRSKNNVEVKLTAFGDNIAFDCNGMFKKSSNTGTLTCEVTNGMKYRGIIKRVYAK